MLQTVLGIWGLVVTIGLAFLGISTRSRDREIDTLSNSVSKAMQKAEAAEVRATASGAEAKAALADHKLYAAENFATKKQVEDLDRKVDQRFDKIDGKLDETLDEIRDRIPRRAN